MAKTLHGYRETLAKKADIGVVRLSWAKRSRGLSWRPPLCPLGVQGGQALHPLLGVCRPAGWSSRVGSWVASQQCVWRCET